MRRLQELVLLKRGETISFNRYNQSRFYTYLFAGLDQQTITLLKRGDDQLQGQVVPHVLYGCWPSIINKNGETLQGAMTSEHAIMWNIPGVELARVGVNYLNPLDRIQGTITKGIWQPEATTNIDVKLMECYLNVFCLRVDQ